MQVLGKTVEENANQELVTHGVPPSDREKEDAVRSEILWTCHRFPIQWHNGISPDNLF